MGTVTKVIGSARGFYDVARYLKKDRETGADRDTGFRMGYNVSPETMEAAREMAQAAERRLMHEPCLHVVLSPEPAEGGRLGPAALDHMVGDLMREMGWQDYQVLAVEHLDTDHQHVHLMINRAHPLHTGESIDGYYLYKDLRSWAQDFDARQQRVALDLFAEGYMAEPSPRAGTSAGERAAGDRVPSPLDHAAKEGSGSEEIEQHQRSVSSAQPSGHEQHQLTDLRTLSRQAGLEREVSTIAELERLAHEKEMALAMLRADRLHLETTGQGLLSDDGRRLLRQTAREIDVILERQQGLMQEVVEHHPRSEPIYLGDGMKGMEPSREARSRDLHEHIKKSYQDLLTEVQPYWMHPDAAVRDMKDLAVLQGPEAVTWAIRHEPEAVGQRTTLPMLEADADRVAAAYRQYEAYRRQYVAEVMGRMDLVGEKTRMEPEVSEGTTGERSKDVSGHVEPSFGLASGDAAQHTHPVEQAEQLYFRDVASRLLDERLKDVQTKLSKAREEAGRLHETVRERAYHHLSAALQETYKDPAEAFRRLEAYHGRGKADLVLRKPDLLGEMRHAGVRERVRGDTPRKRAAEIVRRYGAYVEEPEVRGRLAAASGHVKRLQEERKVLTSMQRRIGTPEAVQRKYGKMRKTLTADERRRLGIRLRHLPGSEVRRQSGALLKKALREYPGKVSPRQIKGLASQKAVNRAIRKTALGVERKMAVKQPLQFAMRASSVATRVASSVYQGARVFFER